MNNYIKIGSIAATTGLKGAVIILHELGYSLQKDMLSVLYIEKNKGSYIPYFIISWEEKSSSEAQLCLESVKTRAAAKQLLKKKIYLDQKTFNSIVQPESDLYFIGFSIIDKGKELGVVKEIVQLPEQILAKVVEGNHELLIPLSEQIIKKTDHARKAIHVDLPEGLLDIYRS